MEEIALKRMEQYGWMIPKQPTSLRKVIEQLTAKFQATQMEHSMIPHLGMHQFNAVHLPKNEELHLTTEQLQIKAIKIPITPETAQYASKDFTPMLCAEGEEDYIYLAYEEQVGYRYSNSNRLYLEAALMQGIDRRDIDAHNEAWMDFFFRLKSYDELYCGAPADDGGPI